MEVLKISSVNFREVIRKITKSIRAGEVIVCPTDTLYGLLANAFNEKAVQKLLRIKKRKLQKPIPIFVKDIKMAKELAIINLNQKKFLEKVWPGKVTVVLKRRENCGLPKILFSETKGIGLRIPDYKIINQLLLTTNLPLTGTSANISGQPASTRIKEVIKQFENQKFQPDLIIDGGNLKRSLSSTVIDLLDSKPKILRSGQISKAKLLNL